ncbi:MAG: beta-N-acetylhexosaminidase [Planctomycetota bacterium]
MPAAAPPSFVDRTGLERTVRGLFLAGWDGGELSPQIHDMLQAGLRGVALFAKNIETATQTQALCDAIHTARGPGGLIGIDQEGGRVARLREDFDPAGFMVAPPMAEVGRSTTPEHLFDLGRLVGLQLKALGINLNFAPVLDVDTNPDNPVIGNRSFGSDPKLVARCGAALARGLQAVGVAACGKHFPGHGDTHQDSHHTLPRLHHDRERLDAIELPPFRHAIDQGIASIMTAHIVFESLNPNAQDQTPATMSPAVINGLLRKEMGFDGVVISDDLEMKAIAHHTPIEEVAVRALEAGVDLLIACHHPELVLRAIDAVVQAVESGRLAYDTVAAAHERVERLAQRYQPVAQDASAIEKDRHERRSLEAKLSAVFAAVTEASASTTTASDPTDYLRPAVEDG